MRRTILILFCIALFLNVEAQNKEEKSKEKSKALSETSVKLYGFVRNFYYFDSRKCLQSSGGLFNQIPMDENINVLGEDLNEVPSARLLAITTRIGLNVTGPEIFGAQSSAKIETDFNGFSSSTTMLRIRHAYFKLNWEHHALLCGQTWHPFIGDLMPDVLSLATGSPFSPFNRSPQLRYDYQPSKSLTFSAASIFQLQYTSVGPNGASFDYSKNSILPELLASVSFKHEGFLAGTGVDFLTLRPRTSGTRVINGVDTDVLVDDKVAGISSSTFLSYSKGKFSAKARCTYGQNVAHLNMMSGYGVTQKNLDGSYDYATLNSVTSWLGITYGKKVKAGLFLGHMENLGSKEDFVSLDNVYVRGYKNIGNMYRITPFVSYNLTKFNVGIEYENTTVSYGKSVDARGKCSDLHQVSNNRICLMAKYNF